MQPQETRDNESQPRKVEVVSRETFFREEWRYRPGQHVTIIGPTQRGKTTFAIELLRRTITPKLKVVMLSGKPPSRDPVMTEAAKKLNLRVIPRWPPDYAVGDRKRNGYVLRPKQTMRDHEADEDNIKEQYSKAMTDCYASKKPVIIMCDEAYQVYVDLKLRREYTAPLMRGAPVCGVWSLLQRGVNMSYLAYNAPEHLFIFHDPDMPNVERYCEMIGGIDRRYTSYVIQGLQTVETKGGNTVSECLYIKRAGPRMMIVETS